MEKKARGRRGTTYYTNTVIIIVSRMRGLARGGTAEPVSRDQIPRDEERQRIFNVSPVRLTTSRPGNHIMFDAQTANPYSYVKTIHAYVGLALSFCLCVLL